MKRAEINEAILGYHMHEELYHMGQFISRDSDASKVEFPKHRQFIKKRDYNYNGNSKSPNK